MKKKAVLIFTGLALVLAATVALGDGQVPITVKAGKSVNICKTGTIICPATTPICDDTSVATMRDGAEGMEIVGVAAGSTTCSAMGTTMIRTIYSVTVK
jgi:hypothetical protein